MRATFILTSLALLASQAFGAAVTTTSAAPTTTLHLGPGPECLPQYLPECVY
ncbi:hypothetical protein BV22DRAFT_1034337 [Leucogyrophana mollusca]|uniref:Uncharacterized protein n=1 Tax=Leucogyrophana mollusca TaxID=85980 RepID=A0ACB8BIS4_9AGAM|nr:hypothetical protein BV22DRAFT_1034337 [Leucogyrophana mollusca]